MGQNEPEGIHIKEIYFKRLGKINAQINNLSLEKIDFSNFLFQKEGFLSFINLSTNELKFDSYYNYGQIIFNNVYILKRLSITNSDIGKTTFINCDFYSTKFQLEDSKILDAFILGTEFPKTFIKSTNKNIIDATSQLKKVYENRGLISESTNYYSMENESSI